MNNLMQQIEAFDIEARVVNRAPTVEHLGTLLKLGISSERHSMDANTRRSQRYNSADESQVLYRSKGKMVTFAELCKADPAKARWLITGAQARAQGLLDISRKQMLILLNA